MRRLMSAMSKDAVTPGDIKDMIKKNDFRIMLRPIVKIDIDRDMEGYFATEGAAMKSL